MRSKKVQRKFSNRSFCQIIKQFCKDLPLLTKKILQMSKMMTLEVLSSIKGAESSEAVDALFDVIKNAQSASDFNLKDAILKNAVSIDSLRDDVVIESSELEKSIIRGNFPIEKNGYLVVSKVIED